MLKMKGTICINAPQATCWDVLADIENITQWSAAVITAKSTGTLPRGVGAARECYLSNNMTINEKWIEWKEGESYTYVGLGLPLVKSAKNTWSLAEKDGKTYLTTESELTFKGGIFGRLLEPLMKIATAKMGANALAALKYLMENGKPYPGDHSQLPRPLAVC